MKKSKELREFTFPDSGKTVYLPAISIGAAAMKLRRQFKPPRPPLQTIDMGNGRKVQEHNYSHPDYKTALVDYEHFIETESAEIALSQIYKVQLTPEQQAEVEQWKEENPTLWNVDLDGDTAIWIENIGLETDKDLEALMEYIGGASLERIEAVQDSFQD